MRLYLGLIFVVVMMAFFTGYKVIVLTRPATATGEDVLNIERIKRDFQKSVNPITVINFNSLYYSNEQFKLLNPIYTNSNDSLDKNIKFSTSENCFKDFEKFVNRENLEKVWIWEEFRCHKRKNLPQNFFVLPPYIHPSGKSFAFLAHQTGRDRFSTKAWVYNHLQYIHVMELEYLRKELGQFRNIFGLLSFLSESVYQDISGGKGTILDKDFLFAKLNYPRSPSTLEYRVYDRVKLDKFVGKSHYILSKYAPGKICFYRESDLCWNFSTRRIFERTSRSTFIVLIFLFLVLAIFLSFLLSKIRQDRSENNRRQMALKVLTHEFRTPIASMLLIHENLTKNLNKFDTGTQEDLLRLSSEIYRLKRLTEMSRHYLKVKNKKALIEFNDQPYESVKEFIDYTLDYAIAKYGEDLELSFPQGDFSVNIDPYWFGILLKNLVDNAFYHGVPPVCVEVRKDGKDFLVMVSDKGSIPENRLGDLTEEFFKGNKSEGSGLGLNIVKNIVDQLNGKLSIEGNPTTFSVKIPPRSA